MMARRTPKSIAIPLVIFVGVEAVCLLTFGCSGAFLIESAFFLAALIVVTIEVLRAASGRSALFGLPSVLVAGALFALQGALCIATAALRDATMPYVAIGSVALLALEAVVLITSSDAEAHAKHVEESTSEATSFMDSVRLRLDTLAIEAQGETKPLVEKTAKEARFANPKSAPSTKQIDARIDAKIEDLADAIRRDDLAAVKAAAASLTTLIKQRSILLSNATKGTK